MRPNSQLFLFSDSFCETIDSWFAGNVIIQQETSQFEPSFNDDTSLIVHFVREVKQLPFTKITTVLNYNEHGLTLAQLSGQFGYMCKLEAETDYRHLRNITTAISALLDAQRHIFQLEECLGESYRYFKNVKGASVKAYGREIDSKLSGATESTDKFFQHIIDTFDNLYKCGYQQAI